MAMSQMRNLVSGLRSISLSANLPAAAKTGAQIKVPALKRPPSAFSSFYVSSQDRIKRNNPNMSQQEVMTLLSKKWADMSNYKKSYYKQIAGENMAEYKKTMDNLTDQQLEEIKNQRSQKRKDGVVKQLKKELTSLTYDKPKKASSGFQLFVVEFSKGKKGSVSDFSAEMSSAWKSKSEAEKERYTVRSQTLMEQYKEKKNAWDITISEDGRKERIAKLKLDIQMKQLVNHLENLIMDKPKRALTGYQLFQGEFCKGKTGSVSDLAGEISSAWREMNEVEKERYNARCQPLINQYKESMAEWEKNIEQDGRKEKIGLIKEQIKKAKSRM